MLRRRLPSLAVVTTLVFALAACGDGSGDGPTSPDPDPDPDPDPQPTTGQIAGTVVDDVGAGVSDVTVHLRESGAGADLATRATSSNGGYSFTDVEAGAYDVVLDVPGDHELDGGTNPRAVDVIADATATADFTLRLLAGTIAGSVLASGTGDGVLDVDVHLREAGSTSNTRTTQTDTDGAYGFDRVATGEWDIAFSAPPATQLETAGTVAVTVADQAEAAADATLELRPVSLSAHVQPVLTSRCASCHAGSGAPDGLELTDGLTHSEAVDVASLQLPSMDLIEPGAPEDSYLVHKIQGTHTTVGGVASRMPLGQQPLRGHLIELIRRWTEEGATDN